MEAKTFFVDTNLFLRYLTNDVPGQADAVESLLQRALKGKIHLVTTSMVIAEIVWTLESHYELGKKEIQTMVLGILNTGGLGMADSDLLLQAIVLYADKNADFIDAFNAAWMVKNGVDSIYTFDQGRQLRRDSDVWRWKCHNRALSGMSQNSSARILLSGPVSIFRLIISHGPRKGFFLPHHRTIGLACRGQPAWIPAIGARGDRRDRCVHPGQNSAKTPFVILENLKGSWSRTQRAASAAGAASWPAPSTTTARPSRRWRASRSRATTTSAPRGQQAASAGPGGVRQLPAWCRTPACSARIRCPARPPVRTRPSSLDPKTKARRVDPKKCRVAGCASRHAPGK